MYKLFTQKNGNYFYILYSDGTKFRQDVPNPTPIFPETMDIKITNFCDAGCFFCHENSNKEGKHAKLNTDYWDNNFQEIAIGGGNPFSHPDLYDFLVKMKKKNKICSITINSFHLRKKEYQDLVEKLKRDELLYGIGVSYHPVFFNEVKFRNKDIVLHVILGIHKFKEIFNLLKKEKLKILILGFKRFGRGVNVNLNNKEIREWKKNWFKLNAETISLDNLAIEQLNIDLTKYKKYYMGEEGKYSMYYDMVKNEVAPSSYSSFRIKSSNNCIKDFHLLKVNKII